MGNEPSEKKMVKISLAPYILEIKAIAEYTDKIHNELMNQNSFYREIPKRGCKPKPYKFPSS